MTTPTHGQTASGLVDMFHPVGTARRRRELAVDFLVEARKVSAGIYR